MKLIKQNVKLLALIICLMLLSLVRYGTYSISTHGNRWFSSGANNYLRRAKANVTAGTIVDRHSVVLAQTLPDGKRQYHRDLETRMSLVHAVGDSANNIAYGAESFMANYLYAFNENFLERLVQAFQGKPRRGNDIRLTLDSVLSRKAFDLFPKNKGGAMVVMNYRTGELLTLQSYPTFDPMAVTQEIREQADSPFWNRATKWVSAPGSTFKVVTLAAALKAMPDAMEKQYECTGALPVDDITITDAGNATHGTITLKKALEVSCNIVYAQVALELGDKELAKTAGEFGFGDYFLFSDLVVENSLYPTFNRTNREIAWTGPGQSRLQTTPLHMCMVAAGIANDGMMMEPKLLLNARNSEGESRFSFVSKEYKRALSAENAKTIEDYMLGVVQRGTGSRAAVRGLKVAGKTGSSQIDGQELTNAWFIGYIADPAFPYAVCVVVEDAGGGASAAAPIAGELFKHLSGK